MCIDLESTLELGAILDLEAILDSEAIFDFDLSEFGIWSASGSQVQGVSEGQSGSSGWGV